MIKNVVNITCLGICLLSCQTKEHHFTDTFTEADSVAYATSVSMDTLPLVATVQARVDSVQFYPDPAPAQIFILEEGVFHDDEITESMTQLQWLGLLKRNQSYFLAPTTCRFDRVHDEILDDDGAKTAWQVSVAQGDTALILLEKKAFLNPVEVRAFSVPEYVYPGESVTIKDGDNTYTLEATGNRETSQANQEQVSNYALKVLATVQGEERKSLLVSVPYFDDNMVRVLFVGDIDGDGLLDFLLDTSHHYNLRSPTLYLSSQAAPGEIVKPVGILKSVGC